MAAFAMREFRRSRRETSVLVEVEQETVSDIDLDGLTMTERLAVLAYMRGVSVRDIQATLNIPYKELIALATRVIRE